MCGLNFREVILREMFIWRWEKSSWNLRLLNNALGLDLLFLWLYQAAQVAQLTCVKDFLKLVAYFLQSIWTEEIPFLSSLSKFTIWVIKSSCWFNSGIMRALIAIFKQTMLRQFCFKWLQPRPQSIISRFHKLIDKYHYNGGVTKNPENM